MVVTVRVWWKSASHQPHAPAHYPGYAWVGGYWYPSYCRYYWHHGYWSRPPFAGAYWVGPRYYGRRYYLGYWRR